MVVFTFWTVPIFFFQIFQCKPVAAQWDLEMPNSWCAPPESFVAGAYAFAVLTLLSDFFYALIPIPMIWSVQMSLQKKLSVIFVLSLGIL
jgi:hypothetical protein